VDTVAVDAGIGRWLTGSRAAMSHWYPPIAQARSRRPPTARPGIRARLLGE
jgi:hypothetical protein